MTKTTVANLESRVDEEFRKIQVRLDTLERENAKLKKKVAHLEGVQEDNEKLKKSIADLEAKQRDFETRVEDTVKKSIEKEGDSYADKLKKNLKATPGKVVTVKQVAEMQDRQRNLVFRGIRELDTDDKEAKRKGDKESILEVVDCAGLDLKEFEEAMLSFRRLGQKEKGTESEKEEHKFRPLLVRLSSLELRDKALRRNRALRETNKQGGTRFRIDADLTREQKKNLDELWAQARQKTEEDSKHGKRYFVIGQENPVLRHRDMTEKEMEEAKAATEETL